MSLISYRIRGWRRIETLQSMLVASGFFALLVLVHAAVRGGVSVQHYAIYTGLIAAAIALHSLTIPERRMDPFGRRAGEDASVVLGQTLSVCLVLLTYLAASKDQTISRILLFVYLPGLFAVLLVMRKVSAQFLGPMIFHKQHRCGAIVVGEAKKAEAAAAWVESKASFGLEAVGWVAAGQTKDESSKLPKLGSLRQLEEVIGRTGASVVLIADFMSARVHIPWLRELCDRCGVRLALAIDFGESPPCSISCYQDGDLSVVTLREEPLESPFNRVLKRTLDIVVALPVVVFVVPVLAVVVRLIQLVQAPGPLMFRQERVGLRGRTFTIYKFRTMHVGHGKEAHQVNASDDRIFPAGKWLRKLSLDEFPQFINVLQGTMSIVGPRPHLGLHDTNFAKVAPAHRMRALIKPGITGLAQVNGFRGPTSTVGDVLGRTRSDLYYLENWSLKLDLMIISRTALQFFRQCGS